MTIELTASSEPASSYEGMVLLPIHQRNCSREFESEYDLTLRAALHTLQARGLDVKRLRVVNEHH